MMKFRIVKVYPKRVLCYCNWHEEKNPSLNISLVEPYYGNYKCFGCGVKGKLSNREMKKLGLDMKKKKRNKPVSINWAWLQHDYRHNESAYASVYELEEKWGVSIESLCDFGFGWDSEAYTFPMYNEVDKVIGIQRRFQDGSKCCVGGSMLGIFKSIMPYNKTLFITEGVSDAVAVYDLGFDAIGRPSCSSCEGMVVDWLNANRNIEAVVIIPDNDLVGQGGAKLLADLIYTNTEKGVEIFKFDNTCKDIRKYIQKVGKEKARRELNEYI